MTWMGNEFGQIDIIDMPRAGNGFNDEAARIKYELADNEDLKFNRMEAFEAHLNRTATEQKWFASPKHEVLAKSEEDKVIVYSRGSCIFAFNFHPSNEMVDYSIALPSAMAAPLRCVLDTGLQDFGGLSTAPAVWEASRAGLKVRIPPRVALVFALADTAL